MKHLNKIFLGLALIGALASCEKEDTLETPVVTGDYKVTIPSFANFEQTPDTTISFFAYNDIDADTQERPFDSLTEDWTFETLVKVHSNTPLDTAVLSSSIIMEQRYVFTLYLTPPNPDKPDGEKVIKTVDYTKPNGVGEKTLKVKADYEINYSKLHNSGSGGDAEILTMTTYDKNEIVLEFEEWVHIAITRDAATGMARLFVNGIMVDESDDPEWISKSTVGTLNLGATYRGGYYGFVNAGFRKLRVSSNARYSENFTPDLLTDFEDDDDTFFMVNLTQSEDIGLDDRERTMLQPKGTYASYNGRHCQFKSEYTAWKSYGEIFLNE